MTKRQPKVRHGAAPYLPDQHHLLVARRLAMFADCELQHGHHGFAEHLSRQAEVLRTHAAIDLQMEVGQ